MSGETPSLGQLGYALPAQPGGGAHVHRDSDTVRFELGPMPIEIFVTSLIAQALLLTVIMVLQLAQDFRYMTVLTWGILAYWAVELVVSVVRIVRRRLTPRVVGATREHVFYSGPSTRGKLITLPRAELDSIGVRRSWWRPWVFELVAVPKTPGFWTLNPSTRGPVVLLLDLDHAVVTRVAMELRCGPSAAPARVLSSE